MEVKELLEYMVKELVDNPDDVDIEEEEQPPPEEVDIPTRISQLKQ